MNLSIFYTDRILCSVSMSKGEVGIFLIDGDVCIKEYRGRFLTSYNSKYSPVDLSKHESVFCFGRVIGIAEPIV